jgi:proteasome accessory factor C
MAIDKFWPSMSNPRRLTDADSYDLMLALVVHLLDQGPVEIAAVAEHFKVSEAAIDRAVRALFTSGSIEHPERGGYEIDLDELDEGIVELTSAGPHQAFQKPPKLTNRQASAIAAGLMYLSGIPGLSEDKELLALQKIMGSEQSEPTLAIERGNLDSDLGPIQQAMSQNVSITCDYINSQGVKTVNREIEPLRIDLRGETAYLRGWCKLTNSLRTFRLDHMQNARPTTNQIAQSSKQAEIDDELYVPAATDTLVTIRVQPEAYGMISDFKATEVREVNETTREIKVKIGDLTYLGRVIARFGGAAKVISPEIARTAVRDFALMSLGLESKTFFSSLTLPEG